MGRVHGIIRLFFILILIILQIIIISFHPILFNLMLILIRLIISFFVLKINSSGFFFFTYVSIFRWSNNSNYLYKYFNYKWKNFFKKIFSFNFLLIFWFFIFCL